MFRKKSSMLRNLQSSVLRLHPVIILSFWVTMDCLVWALNWALLTYLTIPFLPFPSSKHTHVFLQFVDTLIINIWVCWALQRGPSGIWLQQYVNHEIPDVQTRFRKGRGTRHQIANHQSIIKKSNIVPEKHLLLLYWLNQSPSTVWITTNCGKFLKR